MSRRRLFPRPRTFVLAGSLFFLLQASGELKGPSAESEGFSDLMFAPSAAAADSMATPSDTKFPPHAVRRPLGSGWECKRGYRREDDRCVKVQVPAHAFLDPSGHDWECERGYRRQDEGCGPVRIPEHAYLNYFGHDWLCKDGYRRVDTACEPLAAGVPAQQISPKNDLAKLATHVYASQGTSHDAHTIRQLQRQLRQAGYDAGPIDGILGPRTLAALQQFLANRELAAGNGSQAATPSDS